MVPDEEQVKAVELMAKCEACVADLYRVYAEKFPESAEFWHNLVREEEGHEQILLAFVVGLKEGEFFTRQSVFSSNVWASIVEIQEKIREARVGKLTLKEALIVASGIESGFLEKSYFKVVSGDSTCLESLLLRLAEDTERHQELVKDMLVKCRE